MLPRHGGKKGRLEGRRKGGKRNLKGGRENEEQEERKT